MKNQLKMIALVLGIAAPVAFAKEPPSRVDAEGFKDVTREAMAYRQKRIVNSETFLALMKKEGVMVLDTRSESAFKQKHLRGAVHLNFSDFTKGTLAETIPEKDTTILIYCNNNIAGNITPFLSKKAPLALNIPTFINLYGYGYKNVYELGALIQMDDKRFEFEGEKPSAARK